MRYTLWKIKSHKQSAAVKQLKADNEKFRFKPFFVNLWVFHQTPEILSGFNATSLEFKGRREGK